MCLIVQTNDASLLKKNLLKSAYSNNSDGFGVMFLDNDQIKVQKIVPKSDNDIVKLWDKFKDMKIPMGLHFRFTTAGATNKTNCHPFQVLSKAEHGRDIWMMHNGPKLPTPMIDKDKSDTHQYVKWVLRPMLANNPDLLYDDDWKEMIEESIGSDKLLFLDSKTGKFTIINEDHGENLNEDIWLSNTYSIQRGYGEDYDPYTDTYIEKKNKIIPIHSSYNLRDRYGYDSYGSDSWYMSDSVASAEDTRHVELCDDGELFNLADVCNFSSEQIHNIVYSNPTGTAELICDMIKADEHELMDSFDELLDARKPITKTKGGNANVKS